MIKVDYAKTKVTLVRGVAQSGRALGWGPSGRWFKSSLPDQNIALKLIFIFLNLQSD